METQSFNDRHAGDLFGLYILAHRAALDDGAQVIEDIAARLSVLQSVPRDALEGVIEEALEDVVHDQLASRRLAAALVTGSACRRPWPDQWPEAVKVLRQ